MREVPAALTGSGIFTQAELKEKLATMYDVRDPNTIFVFGFRTQVCCWYLWNTPGYGGASQGSRQLPSCHSRRQVAPSAACCALVCRRHARGWHDSVRAQAGGVLRPQLPASGQHSQPPQGGTHRAAPTGLQQACFRKGQSVGGAGGGGAGCVSLLAHCATAAVRTVAGQSAVDFVDVLGREHGLAG